MAGDAGTAMRPMETAFDRYPEPGCTIEVAPGVHWLSTPLPFRLRAINLYLLEDHDGWTIVDCGYSREDVRAQWEQVWRSTLAGRAVTRLVVTHFHPDHVGNSAWICERWGLMPWMTLGEWLTANVAMVEDGANDLDSRLSFYEGNGLRGEQLDIFRSDSVPYEAGVRLPPHFRRLTGGQTLQIGTRQWQVIIGQGHSPEHASLYCAQDRLLISGDQLLPEISTNVSVWPSEPLADPLGQYLDSLAAFARVLDPQTLVLPSHRRPFRGAHARIAQLQAHHDARLQRIVEVARSGPVSAADLFAHLFAPGLDGHQVGFAMGEALAHLNYLVERGRMLRLVDGHHVRFALR